MSELALPQTPFSLSGFRLGVHWTSQECVNTSRAQGRAFSDFDFVEAAFDNKKEHINTIIRIFSVARQLGYQSVLLETLHDGHPLKDKEDDWLRRKNIDFERSEVSRFSFFSCLPGEKRTNENFLGYAVTKTDYYKRQQNSRVYVYESVLAPNHPERNCQSNEQPEYCKRNFLRCKREYEVEIGSEKFLIEGAMYAQQSVKSFVCAHVALRSVLSLLNEEDISYAEIDQIAGRACNDQNGLTPRQISRVLTKKGITARCISKKQFERLGVSSFSPILYGFVESGCPSLLAFVPRGGRVGHIVPVFGHTFDADSWVPESRSGYLAGDGGYFSSEGWLDSFIIHDDNYGPYKTLPRDYFKEDHIMLWGLHKDPAALCFERIEAAALGVCWDFIHRTQGQERLGHAWYNLFLHCADERKLVLRSLFINKDQYLSHAGQYRQIDGNPFEESNLELLKDRLPKKFWMVELSCRELFSAAHAKIGEVLFAISDDIDKEFSGEYAPLVLRLPGVILFYRNDFTKTTALTCKTALTYRTPLFSQ